MNEKTPVTNDNDNTETISKLIESIQSKLNNELDTSNNQDIPDNTYLSSNNTNTQEKSNENPNTNFNLGSIMELLGKMNLNMPTNSEMAKMYQ